MKTNHWGKEGEELKGQGSGRIIYVDLKTEGAMTKVVLKRVTTNQGQINK